MAGKRSSKNLQYGGGAGGLLTDDEDVRARIPRGAAFFALRRNESHCPTTTAAAAAEAPGDGV